MVLAKRLSSGNNVAELGTTTSGSSSHSFTCLLLWNVHECTVKASALAEGGCRYLSQRDSIKSAVLVTADS